MDTIYAKMGSAACNCVGPQDGQPRCPCMMRDVQVKDGRYVRTEDLGPVKEKMLEDSERSGPQFLTEWKR